MIGNASGAEAVALVRAWLKSGRWDEAVALRGVRRRGYTRKQARSEQKDCHAPEQTKQHQDSRQTRPANGRAKALTAEVLAQVQTELADQRGKNVWRKTKKPLPDQQPVERTPVPSQTASA